MLVQVVMSLVSVLAVTGAILNARRRIEGFYLWIVANTALLIRNLCIGKYAQVGLWFAYLVICIVGIATWKKKGRPA